MKTRIKMSPRFSTFTIILLCSNVCSQLVNRRVIRQTGFNPCQSYTPQYPQPGRSPPDYQPDVATYTRTICDTNGFPVKSNTKDFVYIRPQPPRTTRPQSFRTNRPYTSIFPPSTTKSPTLDSRRNMPKNKYAVCGKSTRNAVKIIGGKNASLGDWPWMVAVGYRTPSNPGPLFKCGGTLIADKWVLTAGHCVVNTGTSTVTVARLGDLDLTDDVDDGASPIDMAIEKIIPHPGYSASPLLNDIALLRLRTAVNFTTLIRPLCLPRQIEHRSDTFYTDKAPFIAGWGYTQSRNLSSRSYHLKEAQVDIVDRETCQGQFKLSALNWSLIDERILCAGRTGVDSCQGDSGGPLIMPIKASYYLIGVVSYGIGCANPLYPGVYTRVAYYYDWIKTTTGVEF